MISLIIKIIIHIFQMFFSFPQDRKLAILNVNFHFTNPVQGETHVFLIDISYGFLKRTTFTLEAIYMKVLGWLDP